MGEDCSKVIFCLVYTWLSLDSTAGKESDVFLCSVVKQMSDTGWPAVYFIFFLPFITRGWSDLGQATWASITQDNQICP